jgi:hypothetical protein
MGNPEIICADSLDWLPAHPDCGAIITSLPDANELGVEMVEWRRWFIEAARLCMMAAPKNAPVIFYQTDRKHRGRLNSKVELLFAAGLAAGAYCLWHKIVMRRRPGQVDIHRPGFSHLIAFSCGARPGKASADLMLRGRVIYPNGFGMIPASFAVGFCDVDLPIVDPFCGRGTIPALAASVGRKAIGVDIDPLACARARRLSLNA